MAPDSKARTDAAHDRARQEAERAQGQEALHEPPTGKPPVRDDGAGIRPKPPEQRDAGEPPDEREP